MSHQLFRNGVFGNIRDFENVGCLGRAVNFGGLFGLLCRYRARKSED
jgi:hypothetical protein